MTSLLTSFRSLAEYSTDVWEASLPSLSSELLVYLSLSPGLSSLKIIRMGEGQLEGQQVWGDPQGPAEVQEEADSWARGFSTLCLLQKETLMVGATDGLPGRLLHRNKDSLKPFSSLELQESPSEQRDRPSHWEEGF